MKKYTGFLTALALASTLAACGGGGGDSSVGAPSGPAAWQVAQLLETSDDQAKDADVSINAEGVGYAVWVQDNGGERDVFASRYIDGEWKKAEPVTGALVAAEEPQVAVLPDGEAIAIWRQTVPVIGATVFFNRTNQGTWQSAQILQSVLDSGGGGVNALELKADAQGNAMALWARAGATPNDDSRIFASAYRQGAFQTVTQVDPSLGDADAPTIAIDAAGNVLAAWRQLDVGKNVRRVHVRHNVAGGWKNVVLVSDPASTVNVDIDGPEIAAGPEGVAAVTWRRADGIVQLNTSTGFTTKPWQGIELVANSGSRNQVVVDGAGNTTVVYVAVLGSKLTFNSFRKLPSGGQTLSIDIAPQFGINLALGTDAAGRAIAVWSQGQNGGLLSTVASRLDPATGQWSIPELIEQEDKGGADRVALAVNSEGRALAVWQQQDGKEDSNQIPIENIAANIFK